MDKEKHLAEQLLVFGSRVKHIRIERGFLTQTAFSRQYTGHNKRSSIISRIENGANIDFITLTRLSRVLKTSIKSLLDIYGRFPIDKVNHSGSLEKEIEREIRRLGEKLRALRKAKKMIQLDVALEGLIGDTSISRYERAEVLPELITILSVAKGLRVQPWELFDVHNHG